MKKTGLLFFAMALFACNPLERKLEGTWAIDQAYYNDESVDWDLYTNALGINKNKTCDLPPIHPKSERIANEDKGVWTAFEENGKTYLKIETENWIFNRVFEVHNLSKVQDPISLGYLMKMTLSADSLKLDCTRAVYE